MKTSLFPLSIPPQLRFRIKSFFGVSEDPKIDFLVRLRKSIHNPTKPAIKVVKAIKKSNIGLDSIGS